ncbi:MAG TPA: hypothetical protein VF585_08815 [Chthoniobacterales bacterium]|jgi:hypothetical protein
MAEKDPNTHRLEVLAQRAAASRVALSNAGKRLATASNVSQRVETSIRTNRAAWLGSAAFLGILLAKLPARKKKVYINANTNTKIVEKPKASGGIMVALLGIAFQTAKPYIQKYLSQKARGMADRHLAKRGMAVPVATPANPPL